MKCLAKLNRMDDIHSLLYMPLKKIHLSVNFYGNKIYLIKFML
jgi:hypothetical protein